MIGAPLALLGLLAVAVPVLIHLLGRHQSRVLRFPTLRFIPASRLAPTRRRRISDWPLLLVRAAVVAVAAIALSQPYFDWPGRAPAAASSTVSRAIVVDTSLSMRPVLDSARRLATAASQSAAATLIETDDLRHGVRGALAWLAEKRGTRELTVVSDFQSVAMDIAELASVDSAIGISLVAIASDTPLRVPLHAAPVAFIYTTSPERAGLVARATRLQSAEFAAVVANLRRDATLREAGLFSSASQPTTLDTVATGNRGQPVIAAGQLRDTLALFVLDDSLSLVSAALTDALARVMNPALRYSERDTVYIDPAALAQLNRPALPGSSAPEDASDARWLWALALLLIIAETVMRRRAIRAAPATPVAVPGLEDRAA